MRTRMRMVAAGLVALLLAAVTTVATSPAASAHPDRYDEYYHYFDTGRKWIPFHDTRWVPQGLTKYRKNSLVISYYDGKGTQNSRISMIDAESGKYKKYLKLNFKGHVGGLAMTKKFFWVTVNGDLYRYSKSQLSKSSGSTIYPSRRIAVKGKASFAYAQGENIWTGTWDPKHRSYMYRYSVSSSGSLTRRETVRIPSRVQGVAVSGSKIVWSISAGRMNDSKLLVWPRHQRYDGSSAGNWVTAPNMSEGLVIAKNKLHVLYEAGADKVQRSRREGGGLHHPQRASRRHPFAAEGETGFGVDPRRRCSVPARVGADSALAF